MSDSSTTNRQRRLRPSNWRSHKNRRGKGRFLQWILMSAIGFVPGIPIAEAQNVHLTALPPAGQNERFYRDLLVEKRPALSFNAFSCGITQSVQDRPLQVSFVVDGTDFVLELAEAAPFGFIRLRPAGPTGRWRVVPDFQFDMEIVSSVSTISPVLPDSPVMGLTVGPNPVDGRANIRYEVPSNGWIKLSVFDIPGREVSRLLNGYRSAGTYNREWDRGQLANGVYVLRLESERDSRSVGIILSR